MDWKQLLKNKCPKCNKELTYQKKVGSEKLILCARCGFKIKEQKMLEIISDKVKNNFSQG